MTRERWINHFEEPGSAAQLIKECDDALLSGILSNTEDKVAHEFPNETPLTTLVAISLDSYRGAIGVLNAEEVEELNPELTRMREHLSIVAYDLSTRDILQPLTMIKMIFTPGEAQSMEASSRLIMMWQLLKTRLVLDYTVLRNEFAYIGATQPGND